MKSKLIKMPIEDRDKVRKWVAENKPFTYTLNSRCPNCKDIIYIVKEFGERIVTCPCCEVKFKIS